MENHLTGLEFIIIALWVGAPVLLLGVAIFAFIVKRRFQFSLPRIALLSFVWFLAELIGQLCVWFALDRLDALPESAFMLLNFINLPALISVALLFLISLVIFSSIPKAAA